MRSAPFLDPRGDAYFQLRCPECDLAWLADGERGETMGIPSVSLVDADATCRRCKHKIGPGDEVTFITPWESKIFRLPTQDEISFHVLTHPH